MEDKRQLIRTYVGLGLRVGKAASIAGMAKSSYYYTATGAPKGKRPSTHTLGTGGGAVPNSQIVSLMLQILEPEYHDYGYHHMTWELRKLGYTINPKKVRRLMRENCLLHPRARAGHSSHKKTHVLFTVPKLVRPFATIEVDIKYIYIDAYRRNAYLATMIDTFSRFAAVWHLDMDMKQDRIIALVHRFLQHPTAGRYVGPATTTAVLRSDNGPQFIAGRFAQELQKVGIGHEFIRPGTPQQNAHIEAFHSTMEKLVCSRNIFGGIEHARNVLEGFYQAYNYTRTMKAILYHSPSQFLQLWDGNKVGIGLDSKGKETFTFREKPGLNATGLSSELDWVKSKSMQQTNSFLNP
jgi:putative transposase